MRIHAIVLVEHNDSCLGCKRHCNSLPATVSFNVDIQFSATGLKERLQLAQCLKSERGRAIAGCKAPSPWITIFNDCNTEQRQTKRRSHDECHLESRIVFRTISGAQAVENVSAAGTW